LPVRRKMDRAVLGRSVLFRRLLQYFGCDLFLAVEDGLPIRSELDCLLREPAAGVIVALEQRHGERREADRRIALGFHERADVVRPRIDA
jgi:hypothetical protein